ncbi:dual specificity protein kinase [Chloropicon primus]|uniref:Dual specificity protein kinase n=1 Tax=Chloropicon primus TaxID=1764295 RepID=A0A5B8MGK6_9CHLO|nr:dual specificity protein kinase [Chloropicon primus]|eukprot:QDZ19563.1 dual specificity protein kinase [Chloropicon primus]
MVVDGLRRDSLRRSFSDTDVGSPAVTTDEAGCGGSLLPLKSSSFRRFALSSRLKPKKSVNGGKKKKKKDWVIPLDEIELEETMGSGGTGEVWRGQWQGLDVAVKILYRQGGHVFGVEGNARDGVPKHVAKVEKAFQAEVHSLSSLRHPNIVLFMGACRSHVKVMNTSGAEVQYGIVTEYMSGGSLHDHVHRRDWLETASPRLLRTIVKDITLGMIYLHNEGIIHRDLKSRNILTNNNWTVKIADFDLSRIKQATLYKNDPSSSLIGTPSWMAPELIQGARYDEKVDVYSFAIVLFELLSGEIPFSSNYGQELNHVRILYDVVKHSARPALPDFIPGATKALIARCWSQDPRERPSFADILSVLREENAEERYFCHDKNAHLLHEDEIASISARSLMHTANSSTRTHSPGTTDGNGSSGSSGSIRETTANGVPLGKEKKKKKGFSSKLTKWVNKVFGKAS